MIGIDNDFPWHLSDDLKRFKSLTVGHSVIMGRGNYEHLLKRIGKMLPDRTSIVVSRNKNFKAENTITAHTLEEALCVSKHEDNEVFIIGGAQMFAYALAHADRIYLTEIDVELEGDAYFPVLNKAEWKETSRENHPVDEKHQYSFDWIVLDRL